MSVIATAIDERVVRVTGAPQTCESPDDWCCAPASSGAFLAQLVATRRTEDFDELVFAQPLTPGAPYELTAIPAGTGPIPFTGYAPPELTLGRLDLWRSLPKFNRCMDNTGDLQRFIGTLQDTLDLVTLRAARMHLAYDSHTANTSALGKLLADQGNPFTFGLTTDDARRLSGVLIEIYRQKGTARGLVNAIRLFLGLEVEQIRCHIVTKDDDGIIVGGADPVSVYTFDIAFSQPITEIQRERVRSIAEFLKPAHTHLLDIIQPASGGQTAPAAKHRRRGGSANGEQEGLV